MQRAGTGIFLCDRESAALRDDHLPVDAARLVPHLYDGGRLPKRAHNVAAEQQDVRALFLARRDHMVV